MRVYNVTEVLILDLRTTNANYKSKGPSHSKFTLLHFLERDHHRIHFRNGQAVFPIIFTIKHACLLIYLVQSGMFPVLHSRHTIHSCASSPLPNQPYSCVSCFCFVVKGM